MSEDVSATMRVGITVILVAALVATVLNLMVTSNSLLSGGQTTLQGGIDSVNEQEFATYNNTKVSGTQVATALSLFQGRDVAICIQTSALAADKTFEPDETKRKTYALNYGALLTVDGKPSTGNGDTQLNPIHKLSEEKIANIISPQVKEAYLIRFADSASGSSDFAVARDEGTPYYVGYLKNAFGLIMTNYNTIGTTAVGNDAYLLSSARFSSTLIKDPTGSIIGIIFKQIN